MLAGEGLGGVLQALLAVAGVDGSGKNIWRCVTVVEWYSPDIQCTGRALGVQGLSFADRIAVQ